MTLAPLTDEVREQLNAQNVTGGLVIQDIDAASEAAEMGLRAGDIITEVTQQSVENVAEFQTLVQAARDAGQQSILLLIRRDGNPRFMALAIEDGN